MNKILIHLSFIIVFIFVSLISVSNADTLARVLIIKLKSTKGPPILTDFKEELTNTDSIGDVQLCKEMYRNHISLTENTIKSWKKAADILITIRRTSRQTLEIRAYRTETAEPLIGKGYIGLNYKMICKRFSQELAQHGEAIIASTKPIENASLNVGTPASTEIVEKIEDAALLKVVLLDYELNLLGVVWDDRKKFDSTADRQHLAVLITVLCIKYNIEVSTLAFTYEKIQGGGGVGGDVTSVNIKVSNNWSEIAKLHDNGQLPVVKFRYSTITVFYNKPISVQFSDGTEVFLDDRKYVYKNKKWLTNN